MSQSLGVILCMVVLNLLDRAMRVCAAAAKPPCAAMRSSPGRAPPQDFHVHELDAQGTELHLSELITAGVVAAELRKGAAERREAPPHASARASLSIFVYMHLI